MRAIVPIAQINRRIPEAGRIRIGKKITGSNGKDRPTAIAEFRFTSHDREALEQIGELYGGGVKPWSDPKAADGQFEVLTTAPEIRIVLPPDPLGGSPVYELWGGGGCERRCDGETCTIVTAGPDGPEPADIPCICNQKQEMACKVTTHLAVILPEVRFAGVWRLTTHSWNAVQELPGMVDMIQAQQGRGLSYATLTLKQRRSVRAGETKKFIVPVLGLPASIEQLAAGGNQLGQLPATQTPGLSARSAPGELPAGATGVAPTTSPRPATAPAAPRDDVIDADIVDDEPTSAAPRPGDACPGCGQSAKDGRPVRKVGGVLWHAECATPPTGTPPAGGNDQAEDPPPSSPGQTDGGGSVPADAATPSAATHRDPGWIPTTRELAALATRAFPITAADAPPRRLGWARNRLRYTITAALCAGKVHLDDLDTEEAYRLHNNLELIADGYRTWEATDDGLILRSPTETIRLDWVNPDDHLRDEAAA